MVNSLVHFEKLSGSGLSHFEYAGNKFLQFLGGLRNSYFFISIFIFLLFLTFQGLDLADEGFLANFYQGIFDDPLSMSYNFMFWFTGIVGGIWAKTFGFLGLWGLRLAGAIVITLTALATFQLLKNYIRQDILKLSILCVVLIHNHDIKILNYNTLSSLTFVLLASALLNGLFKNNLRLIFFAGFLVCINVFIRLPNLLQLGMILLIPYTNWLKGRKFKVTLTQTFSFAAGFLVCLAICLLSMRMLGHWEAYQKALQYVNNMSNGSSSANTGSGYYGALNIVKLFIHYNVQAIKYAAITLGVWAALQLVISYAESRFNRISSAILPAIQTLIVIALIVAISLNVDRLMLLVMFCGLPLLSFIPEFLSSRKSDRFIVFLVGVFFLLSFPVGSLLGILTAGRFCLWIALPFAFAFLLKLSTINLELIYRENARFSEHRLRLTENILRGSAWMTIVLLIAASLYHQYRYPFYDWHSRTEMTHSSGNSKLRMIHTTEDRVKQTDELLENVSKYCKPRDYIITYDRIPMILYATDTRSYLSNPFPGAYGTELFRQDLQESGNRHNFLPIVVRQKIHTIGLGSKWPTEIAEDEVIKQGDIGRNAVLDSFLVKNAYAEVWSNQCFSILKPNASR